jgi:hypothetical protein
MVLCQGNWQTGQYSAERLRNCLQPPQRHGALVDIVAAILARKVASLE